MMKKLLFLLLMALFMPWAAQAQITVTIGNGTGTSYNVPFYSYRSYSFVEQLYSASEIGVAGSITSISFYRVPHNNDGKPNGNATQDSENEIVLYMKTTSKTAFDDTNDYVSVSADDIVFEGEFNIPASNTAAGWITITLDTLFTYDGTSNLLVAIDENKAGAKSRYFACTTTSGNTVHYYAHTNTSINPDPYNLSSFPSSTGTNMLINTRANIQLEIIPEGSADCLMPTTVSCSNVTSSSATINWNGGSGLYNVQYKKASDNAWSDVLTNTTSLTTTLTNLDDATVYQARVQSVCDGNSSSGWKIVEFTTECGVIATFPWTEDFNSLSPGNIPACWDNNDGTTPMTDGVQPTEQYWCFTNGQSGNGNANGTSYDNSNCVRFDSYYNAAGKTNFLKTKVMNLPQSTTMQLSFWYKNPTGGDLSVYISTDGGSTYSTALATGLTEQAEWTKMQIELSDYVGTQNVVFVFGGTSNGGSGDAFIYLDDVTVNEVTCFKPTDLAASHVTANGATLNWNSDAESFNVRYRTASPEPTPQGPIFSDDFENGLDAWTTVRNGDGNEYTDWQVTSLTNAHSGNNVAISRSYDDVEWEDYNVDNWLITPQVTLDGTLSFWVMDDGTAPDYFEVYISTNGNEPSDFEFGDAAVSRTAPNEWTEITVDLSSYAGALGYIAIRHKDEGNGFILIDDFSITANAKSAIRTVPFSDDFENGLDAWTTYQENSFTDLEWEQIDVSDLDGLFDAHSGDYVAWSSSEDDVTDNWLVTPQVTLDGTLSFWVIDDGTTPDHFEVYISTNGNEPDDFESGNPVVSRTAPNVWTEITVDLSSYAGAQGYIAIRHNDEEKGFILIDDFSITINEEPEPIVPDGKWRVVTASENSLALSGLTANTTYEVQVQTVCGNDDASDWSNMVNFTTCENTFYKEIAAYTEGEKDHYYLIASPINQVNPEQVVNMLENQYDLYYFDQTQDLEWINYEDNNDGGFNLEPGKGYLYANSQNVTLAFNGWSIEENTFDVRLVKDSNAEFPGMNLVGNPFSVGAYIDRPFYRMAEGGTAISSTASSDTIKRMEGVFVEAARDGETMTFSTNPNSKIANLALNLTKGNSFLDRAIVCFSETRQLSKFQLRKGSTQIYIPMEGKDYAVVRSEEMGTIPVNFKAEDNGTYTLSFTTEGVSFGYLHLIDNMTGNDVDLLAGASTSSATYTFEAKTTDYESRFKLVFATGDNANDDTFAFFSNGNFVINNEGEATLQVFDMNGRILKSENINGCANVNVKAAAGVYMLRLVNGNDVKVQKVVVK